MIELKHNLRIKADLQNKWKIVEQQNNFIGWKYNVNQNESKLQNDWEKNTSRENQIADFK